MSGDSAMLGSLVNGGTIDLIGSSLTVSTTFTNSGTAFLTDDSSLEVFGNASNSGTLSLGVSPFEGTGTATIHGSFTNTNGGTVHLDSLAHLGVQGTLINNGSVDVDHSYLTVDGDVNNSGTISTNFSEMGGSTLTIAGTLTNSGSFLLNGAASPEGDNATIGSIVNRGTIDLENAST